MNRNDRRELATAYHEAGHAVVGIGEGVPNRLLQVSIVPDPAEGTLGHVARGAHPRVLDVELGSDGRPRRFYRPFDPTYDDGRLVERRLKPRVVELFAGVLAEKQFTGRRHNWLGASHDLAMAADFILYMTGSERQAQKLSDYLWIVAEDAVDSAWTDIEPLAQELLERKTMPGAAVRAFLWAHFTGSAGSSLNLILAPGPGTNG